MSTHTQSPIDIHTIPAGHLEVGNVYVFPTFQTRMGLEIERRARSRAELFMLEDHRNSLKLAGLIPRTTYMEELGYGRGYRDAMVEVMTWVTGRDSDEILSELHDQIVGAA